MSENNDFDFKTVLELSKLEPLNSDEEKQLKSSFNKILNHVEVIKNKVLSSDDSSLEMTHVHSENNALREDNEDSIEEVNMNVDSALMNAPDSRDRCFITPLIIQAKKEIENE